MKIKLATLFFSLLLLITKFNAQIIIDTTVSSIYKPYMKFMEYLPNINYFDSIKPDKRYTEWETDKFYNDKYINVYRSKAKNVNDSIVLTKPVEGLAPFCFPAGNCFWYISAKIKNHKKPVSIITDSAFNKFIGRIDNIYDALFFLHKNRAGLISNFEKDQVLFKAIDRGYLITLKNVEVIHCPTAIGNITYYIALDKRIFIINKFVTKQYNSCP